MYSETCPYRKRGNKCSHSLKVVTRLSSYKWNYPRNHKFYLRYTKTVETCQLNQKNRIVSIKIEQDNDFTHKPTWWEMRINA
jgi:hypothetical protein